jgi:hypothetical protein
MRRPQQQQQGMMMMLLLLLLQPQPRPFLRLLLLLPTTTTMTTAGVRTSWMTTAAARISTMTTRRQQQQLRHYHLPANPMIVPVAYSARDYYHRILFRVALVVEGLGRPSFDPTKDEYNVSRWSRSFTMLQNHRGVGRCVECHYLRTQSLGAASAADYKSVKQHRFVVVGWSLPPPKASRYAEQMQHGTSEWKVHGPPALSRRPNFFQFYTINCLPMFRAVPH